MPSYGQLDRVDILPDVVYGHKDGLAMTYDVYQPKENRKGIGLVLMVSGGWVSMWSPPEKAIGLIQPLVNHGYTVLTVRHGSSPKYLIPEIVSDVRFALQHISDNAAKYDIDPKRLGVFGFSAGGHLSLMLGTTTNQQEKPHVAAVAAVFPPTDLEPYMELKNPLRERFPALKFELERGKEFSPLRQVSSDDAPTVLIHGDKDDLVPLWHSEKIRDAFNEAKVPNKLVVIEGAGHGFDAKGNQRMFDSMIEWFDQHLGKK